MEERNKMKKQGKPIKVINISGFNRNKPEYHPKPTEEAYYVASWAGLWARRIKARYPGSDIEVWRSEPDFYEISYRKAFGVDCTIFPAKYFIVYNTVTLAMMRRLLKYNKAYNLVIHRNSVFDWKFNIIISLFFPKAKIVLSHHGGLFPIKADVKSFLKRILLKFSYKKIDTITYLRKSVKKFIESSQSKIHFEFLPVGANFDHFKPLDKSDCRRKLNLPVDKVLGVYVGSFYKLKGVDHILNLFYKLKNRNFEVLFVGGKTGDELYHEVEESGCRHWGYVNHDVLKYIYSASDFYIHPVFDKNFGGIDVSWMEALACNRPVLTPLFKELDFDYSELGLLLDSEDTTLPKVEKMMQSYFEYNKCRQVAIKHLDGNTSIIDKLYEIYIK